LPAKEFDDRRMPVGARVETARKRGRWTITYEARRHALARSSFRGMMIWQCPRSWANIFGQRTICLVFHAVDRLHILPMCEHTLYQPTPSHLFSSRTDIRPLVILGRNPHPETSMTDFHSYQSQVRGSKAIEDKLLLSSTLHARRPQQQYSTTHNPKLQLSGHAIVNCSPTLTLQSSCLFYSCIFSYLSWSRALVSPSFPLRTACKNFYSGGSKRRLLR